MQSNGSADATALASLPPVTDAEPVQPDAGPGHRGQGHGHQELGSGGRVVADTLSTAQRAP